MGESLSLAPFATINSKEGSIIVNPKLISLLEELKVIDAAIQNPITPP